jgi:thioredoxin 1
MIVYFTGTWCAPCRIMKRNVWADMEVAFLVNAGFVPEMVVVDYTDSTSANICYNVEATSNTAIIDAQGNALLQKAGGIGKAEFLEILRALNSSPETNSP